MKLTLARDVTLTVVDTGAVLLDGRRGRYWQLNHSGAGVLRQLLDGNAPDAAAAGLCAAAPVSDDQARQDVQALIDALSAAKLVEVAS
ncbi:lasso peptide biosynthesis PqqD family chaperone [Streptomyces sp. NPDC007896]|uniref:lasso peptide biosynthesis PqqD family chaperone n=1 Tax=unclassified Streptomyces TaxID=2593676 RepID=UPI00143E7E07|nr:lasso peptide biosynthesis PqqD family chaperone [Streptomyces sp. S1D4-11]QIY96539.1 lasso peptide biosynthesis PqqD family chaperone [Streptomyces sp. S1D4-11]